MSLWTWIYINFKIGALSFGSSSRIPLFHREVVEKEKSLSDSEFREVLTLAQVIPGPNLINLSSYLGLRLGGWKSLLAGILLLAIPGPLIAIAALPFINLNNSWVIVLFQGFSLGSMVLLAIFIQKLIPGLRDVVAENPTIKKILPRYLLAVLVMLSSLMGFPLLPVLLSSLAVGILIEFLPPLYARYKDSK